MTLTPPAPIAAADGATLTAAFGQAVRSGPAALARLAPQEPADDRDAWLCLLAVHDLHLAPVDPTASAHRLQHRPEVAALKLRLEERYLERLRVRDEAEPWALPDDAVAALRALAALDLVPDVYRWLADEADRQEVVEYLAFEGGPDGGFDDLVAICQLGLQGEPKLEMARNYWDEMGRGELADVHTELHHRLVGALDLPAIPRHEQPVEALERTLLGSLLATNRWLQPEMVGALGLIEMQAGPRCRHVMRALERLGAGDDALAFYVEHAQADPRHGKDWLDHVAAPLAAQPGWVDGIVRGARWRSLVNRRFFAAMAERLCPAAALAEAS